MPLLAAGAHGVLDEARRGAEGDDHQLGVVEQPGLDARLGRGDARVLRGDRRVVRAVASGRQLLRRAERRHVVRAPPARAGGRPRLRRQVATRRAGGTRPSPRCGRAGSRPGRRPGCATCRRGGRPSSIRSTASCAVRGREHDEAVVAVAAAARRLEVVALAAHHVDDDASGSARSPARRSSPASG